MKSNSLQAVLSGTACFLTAAVFFLLSIMAYNTSCFAGTTEEITHLLSFIETSECTFIRNGKEYPSQNARKHIQQKYEYLHNRITNAEEFIQYTASRSSTSGEPYRVFCNNREMTTADWLTEELEKLRAR